MSTKHATLDTWLSLPDYTTLFRKEQEMLMPPPHEMRVLQDHARMLKVTCPKCRRTPGAWCRGPSQHLLPKLHVDRWRQAVREGWQFVQLLTIPDMRGER